MPPNILLNTSTDSLNAVLHLKKVPPADSIIHPSFFQGHLLETINKKPLIHYTSYEYGTAALLFLTFILFVWIYVTYRKFLNQLFKNLYSTHIANQSRREENSIINRGTVVLSVMFLIVLSLFIAKTITLYAVVDSSYYGLLILKTAGILIILYTIKLAGIRFLGFVFKNVRESLEYITAIILFWNASALFLLPVLSCLLFLKQLPPQLFVTIGMIGIAVFLAIRLVKLVFIGLNSARISKVYLFLYLCTLEILPFVIVYKLFLIGIQ